MAPPADGDPESLPLSLAFDRAFQLYGQATQQGAAPAPAPAAAAAGAQPAHVHEELLRLLGHCEQLVERASLFSRNEDQDDLPTSSMRYLLVPFMRGDVLNACMPQRSAAQRLPQAGAAKAALAAFLQRASQYGLLGPACAAAYEGSEGGPPDPGTARTQKIERFKRSKAVAGLVQQLTARQRRADEEAGTEGGPPGGVGGWDEEDERLLWRLQLEGAAIKALDALPLLEQELQLLQRAAAAAAQQPPGSREQSQHARDGNSSSSNQGEQQRQQQQRQQQMMHRLSDIAGQLSLGQDRQAVRQQVLRPGHILPTLTVEQQGDIEVAAARQREQAQRAAAAAAAAAKADARSDDEDEEALAKQRAWDEFTDDNPRGWGNSKLRPCA